MKKKGIFLFMLLVLYFLATVPSYLNLLTKDEPNNIALAQTQQSVDQLDATICFPPAIPSLESEFHYVVYPDVSFNDPHNFTNNHYWWIEENPPSCLNEYSTNYKIHGVGDSRLEVLTATSWAELSVKAIMEIVIYTLTGGTLYYKVYHESDFSYGGTYTSATYYNGFRIAIYNKTKQGYDDIVFSSQESETIEGSFEIKPEHIDRGKVSLRIEKNSYVMLDDPSSGAWISEDESGTIIVYLLYIDRNPLSTTCYVEHTPKEDYIVHKITIYNPEPSTTIKINKPTHWNFYMVSPNTTVVEATDHVNITGEIQGDYDVYFTSTDFWNYPRRYETRISYFDQKGDYIPFESVFTYYNLSWSEVKPTYEPLYSDVFTMDPAQYLSIKVVDRWNNVLLEEGNLTYQDFYNFTLTMYTFQVYSFQDDFVYVKIKKTGTADWYGQHLAPNEALKLRLYPTDYDLQVAFPNGTIISDTFTLNNDTAYLISGYTLTKLVGLVVVSMVRYFDPLGLPLSFEEFKTYYNVSSQPIATPKYIKLPTEEFLMTDRQYLHIRIMDLWNHTIIEQENLSYSEFFTFTLNVTKLTMKNPYEDHTIKISLTASTTGVTNNFTIPPLETVNIHLSNDTYSYVIELIDPTGSIVKTVSGSFNIPYGQIEYIILFGWNVFPDAYMEVNFLSETGTINLACEISIYMNHSKLPIPSVSLEIYVNDSLAGTGITDPHGKSAIVLNTSLVGMGTLSIKATKLGVTRWFNTTYNIWGWMVVEEPPMIVQGEVGTYNIIFSNPSRIGNTPVAIENATVIFRIYGENTSTPAIEINKTTIDIPPGSSQFTFTLNTTDLLPGNYVLEIEVIYANSTFAKKQIPFTVTPKPEYRVVVPWWLIVIIALIVAVSAIVGWLIIQIVTKKKIEKRLYGKTVIRPRGVEKTLSS